MVWGIFMNQKTKGFTPERRGGRFWPHLADILGLSKTYSRERSLTRLCIYGAVLIVLGVMVFVDAVRSQESDSTLSAISTRTIADLSLEDGETVPVDLKLIDLPGAPSELDLTTPTLKAYMRAVEVEDELIGQLVLAGVEKDGVLEPLQQSDFAAQFELEDADINAGEALAINGDTVALIEILTRLQGEEEQEVVEVIAGVGSGSEAVSSGGSGSSNEQAAAYTTPDAIAASDDPVIAVSTTTEGCEVRIDEAQGVAIEQSRSITTEDGVVTSEGTCSDTLNRFSLEKSYAACSDLVDLTAMTASAQYVLYYVDDGAERHDVSECGVDPDYVFEIVEDESACSVYLDFADYEAVPQAALTYTNKNNVETQVRGCQNMEDEAIAMEESAEGCTLRHDFDDNQSVQLTSWTYLRDGLTYLAQPCTDSDTTYAHESRYYNNGGEYLCDPVINEEAGTVTLQSKIGITVDSLWTAIAECEPDQTSLAVSATTDGCENPDNWTHDLTASISYGQHRHYYLNDGDRVYINDCQSSSVTYPHQIDLVGYQRHDNKLLAYPLTDIWIETDWGKYIVQNKAVTPGATAISYIKLGTETRWNGQSEYTDNSCTVYRLTDQVEIWQRPDVSEYEKKIGEGTPQGPEDACTSIAMQPIWEWTKDQSKGSAGFGSSSYRTTCGQHGYACTVYSYSGSIAGEFRGKRIINRDDGKQITQYSKKNHIIGNNCKGYTNRNWSLPYSGSSNILKHKFGRVTYCNPTYTGSSVYSWNQAEGW